MTFPSPPATLEIVNRSTTTTMKTTFNALITIATALIVFLSALEGFIQGFLGRHKTDQPVIPAPAISPDFWEEFVTEYPDCGACSPIDLDSLDFWEVAEEGSAEVVTQLDYELMTLKELRHYAKQTLGQTKVNGEYITKMGKGAILKALNA